MTENTVDRKLRAILSADVKGYSRMMGEDEEGTHQTLTANLKSIRSKISGHNDRVFSHRVIRSRFMFQGLSPVIIIGYLRDYDPNAHIHVKLTRVAAYELYIDSAFHLVEMGIDQIELIGGV